MGEYDTFIPPSLPDSVGANADRNPTRDRMLVHTHIYIYKRIWGMQQMRDRFRHAVKAY